MYWQTSRRTLSIDRPLVMAILNVTPDSFSDGGKYADPDAALRRAEFLIGEGADIIDIGGESTRPGSAPVDANEESLRTVPIVEAITRRFDTPISIDTTKSTVARRALDAGAEIVNDISGLRFDAGIANIAADSNAGLVLMNSRGSFGKMHAQLPVGDILKEVSNDFHRAIREARQCGVGDRQIMLDIGIGFGKTLDQNLELLAKLDRLVNEFSTYPILVGTSRKSFIGKILGDGPPTERLSGSLASALVAIGKGARIVRVHDVRPTIEAIRVTSAISVWNHGL